MDHQDSQAKDFTESAQKIQEIVDAIIASNEAKKALDGLELIKRLIDNILKTPQEAKKRTVNKTIPKIKSTIFEMKGDVQGLFIAMGFTAQGEDSLVFMGDYLKVLNKASHLINDSCDPLRVQFMTPDERKKHEILMESKRIYAEEQRKKKNIMEQQKKLQKYDRQEKATEEVKKSVGNKLNFGANMVKFEPPVRKGG